MNILIGKYFLLYDVREAVTVDITTIHQYSVLFSSILKDVHETLVHKMCVKTTCLFWAEVQELVS